MKHFATSLFTIVALAAAFIPAAAQAQAPIKDGVYRVNEQIAPGTYRSTAKGARCYWERSGESENILDNHAGLAGGVVTIQPTDFQFESRGCGPWVFSLR